VVPVKGLLKEVESQGNMFTVKVTTLDMALWKIGGVAVALHLVQLAQVLSFVSMVVGFRLIDGVAHLKHFTILVQMSQYRAFNTKQRMAKMGLVRKLLFTLQAEWSKPS